MIEVWAVFGCVVARMPLNDPAGSYHGAVAGIDDIPVPVCQELSSGGSGCLHCTCLRSNALAAIRPIPDAPCKKESFSVSFK